MRRTKGALVALLAALTLSAAASVAQTGDREANQRGIFDPPRCPTITVSCPDTPSTDGSLIFTANVSGGDPNVTPTFKWTVSHGVITGGQGTFSITADISNVGNEFVTATVDVGGYERYQPHCAMSASCTNGPGYMPVARKVDEYSDIKFNDEKARLDNYAIELQNDPAAQGYLICYGGRRSRAGEAQRRCERAMKHASTHFQGIEPLRLVTVDGGYREELTVELWIVPSGATLPQATPTVDPKEVRPPTSPRKARRRAPSAPHI